MPFEFVLLFQQNPLFPLLAAMAAVALRKGGRRWRQSAERAVVRAVRVAGGSGTCANESRTIHAKLGPKMVTNWQGGGGGKASKSAEYGRSYPVCTEEPVRREGATGPERPKRMRPDGAVCYVEGKNGGLGVKRRNVQQGEQPGRPPGRPPEPCYCAAARRAYLVVPEIGVLKWLLEIRRNGSVNLEINGRF